jgi:N-acetylglucosaminyldiphosphoundecaprenol N-acetyl-beta-D-mannosaminyltransferase
MSAYDAAVVVSTEHLFGLDFVSDGDIEAMVTLLLEQRNGAPAWQCVVTPNVDHLVRYTREPEEAAAGHAATLVLPDGAPIVWASRVLGRPLARRLTGADLFTALWPRLVADAIPIVVIAASSAVAERINAAHPMARCVVAPMFDVDDQPTIDRLAAEADALASEIRAEFVVVGVSMPKHHRIANALRARWTEPSTLPMPTVLLVGAAPEFALGLTKRAPQWMQRTGTEWVHRLVTDPRRLAKRYLVDDTQFVRLVWREWRRGP